MSAAPRIRVLVIDDSAFSRQAITRMLAASPLVEVVGTARDGEEALRRATLLAPDLITLDLEMPRMDGFTLLRILTSRRPTPVIVISGRGVAGDVFRALELGAVDFIAKPTREATSRLASIEGELLRKVHAVRELRLDVLGARWLRAGAARPRAPARAAGPGAPRVAALGASTGGPAALMEILSAFEAPPPTAVLVAQHMPEGFTRDFAARLDRLTAFSAREAAGGEEPAPGCVLVAPGGCHLEVEAVAGSVRTRVVPAGAGDRFIPSVDRLFESAGKAYGAGLLAVVLTGMGDDGSRGVLAVKAAGGAVVAESEATAVIHGMPGQAIRTGAVDRVLPLPEIAEALRGGVRRGAAAEEGRGAR